LLGSLVLVLWLDRSRSLPRFLRGFYSYARLSFKKYALLALPRNKQRGAGQKATYLTKADQKRVMRVRKLLFSFMR